MARPKKFARPGVPVPARPAKDTKAKGASTNKSTDGPDRRKRGFQVGPAHAPRNAYLGKVKKIKDDLIVKAKLKKQYAKVLKETGGSSARLKDRSAPGGGKSQAEGEKEDEAGGQSDGGAAEASERGRKGGKPGKLDRTASKSSQRPPRAESSSSTKEDRRGALGLKRKRSDPSQAEASRPTTDAGPSSTRAQPRKVRALSPSDISAPMPQTSLRELKKEAFKKYHPARQHSSASLRVAPTAAAAHAHGARRAVSAGSTLSGPPGAGKGMRGQPNMAARMGVLLEKIKRDKTA